MGDACGKFLLIILSLLCPPIAIWIARNKICSCTVCINILLTLLGWVNIFVVQRNDKYIHLFLSRRFLELFMPGVLSVAVTSRLTHLSEKSNVCVLSMSLNEIHVLINYFIRVF